METSQILGWGSSQVRHWIRFGLLWRRVVVLWDDVSIQFYDVLVSYQFCRFMTYWLTCLGDAPAGARNGSFAMDRLQRSSPDAQPVSLGQDESSRVQSGPCRFIVTMKLRASLLLLVKFDGTVENKARKMTLMTITSKES